MDYTLHILEIIGTIAFAVSGAFVAIKAKFDIFGVIVVGCITAVGGGILRDVLIGCVPPRIFANGYLVAVAAVTSVAVFGLSFFAKNKFEVVNAKADRINNVFDAIGLAAFTVMGTEVSFENGFSANCFLSVTVGVLTAVGGGLLRDIFTENLPYIFKKHIYALASIGGSLIYYLLRNVQSVAAVIVGLTFVIAIRLLATKFRWSLPKIDVSHADNLSHGEDVKQAEEKK